MRYLRTEKLRSFHLRPFIVSTITIRALYQAERERQHAAGRARVRERARGLGFTLRTPSALSGAFLFISLIFTDCTSPQG